jgi:hypothetical protein
MNVDVCVIQPQEGGIEGRRETGRSSQSHDITLHAGSLLRKTAMHHWRNAIRMFPSCSFPVPVTADERGARVQAKDTSGAQLVGALIVNG